MPVAQSRAAQQASPPPSPSTQQLSAQQCESLAAEPTRIPLPQYAEPSTHLMSQPHQAPAALHDADAQPEPSQPTPADQERIESSRRRSFELNNNVMVPYNLLALIVSVTVLVRGSDTDAAKLRTWLIVFVCVSSVRIIARYVLRRLSWRAMHASFIACHVIDTAVYLAYISWFFVAVAYLVDYKDQPQVRTSFIYIFIACIVALELTFFFFVLLFATIIFFFAASPVRRRPSPGATAEDLSKLSSYKFVVPQDDVENPPPEGTNMCSICLSDFAEDELLRELPCPTGKHTFHAECVDEWLMRRKSCPICREDPFRNLREEQADQESPETSSITASRQSRSRFGVNSWFSRTRTVAQDSQTEHAVINVESSS